MKDLNDLYFYAHVVEHGGFAPAARAPGLPKSRLSRRVFLLEERLGMRLLQRTSRRFAVTEIGQIYHEHCKAMLVEADAAEEAASCCSICASPAWWPSRVDLLATRFANLASGRA